MKTIMSKILIMSEGKFSILDDSSFLNTDQVNEDTMEIQDKRKPKADGILFHVRLKNEASESYDISRVAELFSFSSR